MSTQDPTPPPPGSPYGSGQSGSTPPYGQSPEVPQAPQYGQAPEHGQARGYGQAPEHGQQPPQYGQVPAYGQGDPYGAPAPRNGLGLAALIVGIVAIVIAIIPGIGVLGYLGVVAVILGILGLSRVRKRLATNRGAALTGLILGILSVVLAVVWTAVIIWGFSQASPALQECAGLQGEQLQTCLEENLAQP